MHDLDLLVDHGAKVFAYYFTHAGTMTLVDLFRLKPLQLMLNMTGRHLGSKIYHKDLGACHGDDLLYVFPFAVPGFPGSLKTDNDKVKFFWDLLSFFHFLPLAMS